MRVFCRVHYGKGGAHAEITKILPSSPKGQFFNFVPFGNKFYYGPNVLYFLFSIRQVLPFTFPASTKVKSNQVYLLHCDLKTFKFMASISVEV